MCSGNSTILEELNKVHGVKARFSNLAKWAQIVIIAVVVGVGAIALAVFFVFCLKSRKAGRIERARADAEWEKHEMEMAMLKKQMRNDGDYDAPIRGYDAKNIASSQGRYV